jgi:diaminopimelate decarboxylase
MTNSALSFEGIGKTDGQLEVAVLEAARGRPLRWLAIESAEEADRLAQLASAHHLGRGGRPPLDILLRLNPQVSPETRAEFAVGRAASKFGMTEAEIHALVRGPVLDGPGLRLRGIHVHVGSDLGDVGAWAGAGVRATRVLGELAAVAADADTVDFGGGFPLPADNRPDPAAFCAALMQGLDTARLALPARPAIEPGRYLVGGAGWLVSTVLHARAAHESTGQAMAVLDAGMTEFIRPALYQSHHRAYAIPLDRWRNHSFAATSLEGPVCESTDSFGSQSLPTLRRGDVVAIEHAGAYGASFTSRYNGRPAPAEVLHWPDGSLEPCDRPEIVTLASDRQSARAAESASPLGPFDTSPAIALRLTKE